MSIVHGSHRGLLLAWSLTTLLLSLKAQNEEDALRYSSILPGGTARSWGLAGAFGAVGADPASASINPAGFGLYSTSELSLTLGLEVNNAEATYYGTKATAGQQRFSVNNMALVLSYPNNKGTNWRGATFGLSLDRQASYHWKQQAVGERVNSTVLSRFVNEANGHAYSDLEEMFPFTSHLAWYTWAIDTLPGMTDQYSSAIPSGSEVRQQHDIDASGRLRTTSLFYSNNYKDKLYLGLSVGIVGVRYERHTIHQESTLDEAVDLRSVRYNEDLLTTGNGVDVKVGVIGRITERIRLGAAFHSPMWLSLSDAYSYQMATSFRNGDAFSRDSPSGTFSYRVTTPWRVVGSATYQAGKHGLVSIDYAYADPRESRLRAAEDLKDVYDFELENEIIKKSFVATNELRVGTEWRSGKWYFRGGWAFQPDAYADEDARQGTAYRMYCGGIGYRTRQFSVDLAAVYGTRDVKYFMYDPSQVQPVSEHRTDLRTLLTMAWRP